MPAPPHRIHRRSRQPVPIRRGLLERALPPVVKTRQIAVGASARSERGAAVIEMAVVSSLLMIVLLVIIGNSSVLDDGYSTQASHNVLWVDVLGIRRASAAGVVAYGVIQCVVRLGLIDANWGRD